MPASRPIPVGFLLAVLTFACFSTARHFDYIELDDPDFISANPHELGGLSWAGIKWAFQLGHGDYWHPVTWLSLMCDVSLFGPGPAGPHLVNVLLHTANMALLFWLLRRWTGAVWRSAMVAALFGLHPLRVESVAWVTERKDVLSALFWLLTLWAYGRYVSRVEGREPRAGRSSSALDPRPSTLDYLLALAFFALGLMSKATLVTVPFVLLLLDYWPLRRWSVVSGQSSVVSSQWSVVRGGRQVSPLNFLARRSQAEAAQLSTLNRLVAEKIPYFVLSGVSCVVTYWGQHRVATAPTPGDLSWWVRFGDVWVACLRYVEKTLWPVGLSVSYPHPGQWAAAEVWAGVALVAGVSVWVFRAGKIRPYALVGWLWFLGTVAPMLGVTKGWTQYMADRFTYVPSMGLFVALVWGMEEARRRWRVPVAVAGLMGMAVVGACVFRTRDQLRYWRNSEALFRHAIDVTHGNNLAWCQLGTFFAEQHRADDAAACFREALRINPEQARVLNNLSVALLESEKAGEAEAAARRALDLEPANVDASYNLGNALAAENRAADAVPFYRRALDSNPRSAAAWVNLGNALVSLGRLSDARAAYQQAVKIEPDCAEACNDLGYLEAVEGHAAQAMEFYGRALRIKPAYSEAHFNLGRLLSGLGRWAEAADQYEAVLRVNPGDPQSQFELGRSLAALGRTNEATSHLDAALRLKPDFPEARRALDALQPGPGRGE